MINGYIQLSGGTRIPVTDENLVGGSLSVTMSVCGSEFMFGTFNAAVMKIGIIDPDAAGRDYNGAQIVLQKITDSGSTYLGKYTVLGNKTKRKRDTVTLTAQDASSAFGAELGSSFRETEYTPYNALVAVCSAVGVALATSDFSGFPNTGITIKASSESIQTYRDYVMWIAQLLCANAVINRGGALELRSAMYKTTGTTIITDRVIPEEERAGITFSDTRMFVKYMSSYAAGKAKEYTSTGDTPLTLGRAGKLRLLYNPLTESMTEEQCDTINNAMLNTITNTAAGVALYQRTIKAKLFDDPDVYLGETLKFTGRNIDIYSSEDTGIISMVTGITWKYHGITTVTCAAPEAV